MSVTLERHIFKCRQAYVDMECAADHITYQFTNKSTKVQHLLDSMEDFTNPKGCATTSAASDIGQGTTNNFKKVVMFLLPTDPVAKMIGQKRNNGQISSTVGRNLRSGLGTTGMALQCNENDKYRKLTTEKKGKLRDFRLKDGGKTQKRNFTSGKGSQGKAVTWNNQLKAKVDSLIKAE